MSSHRLTPSTPIPEPFRPEKFKSKSKPRDYLIYASVLILFVGLVGGTAYYLTRTEAEKEQLVAKIKHTFGVKDKPDSIKIPALKPPKLDGLLDRLDGEPKEDPAIAERKTSLQTGAVSTYSGSGQNGVSLSPDAKLPKPSAEFIQFTESLKVSSVVQGNPAKVMLNGRMYRTGAVINPDLGVTFQGVDGEKSYLLFRDGTGAELRLSY
ncbi:MAG: hypothetical protein WC205_06875 [Opitutaceae bacterium]|jgi:hypothetical protein